MNDDRSIDQELLKIYRDQLRVLEIQEAQFGLQPPAYIVIEIATLRQKIAALELRPAHPAGKHREWLVDQMHRGDHTTIGAAIAAASPGDRIVVREGVYREALLLDKPLEIIGESGPGDVLVQASGASVLSFDCIRGVVRNLTLRQTGGKFWTVVIKSGRLDLEDCDISNSSHGGVTISGEAHPRLRRNRIHDNQGNGVQIIENGQDLLEENEIFNHAKSAVIIKTGASPILRRNRIHDNQDDGVYILENGQGLLEENEIFNNVGSAVVITTGASPTLRRNRIHDNQSNGIWVYNGGGGVFEHNTLQNNKGGDWNIAEDCVAMVKRTGN